MYKKEEFSAPEILLFFEENYRDIHGRKKKDIMCKYTSYTEKYTLYTGIEKQRLFLLKNFFINIQTNVRSTRTRWR